MRIKINTGFKSLPFSQAKLFHDLYLILYKLSLDLLYLIAVTPHYNYSGMVLHFSIPKYVISTIVFLLMVRPVVNLYNKGTLSSMVILVINLLYFIPGCTLYSFAGLKDVYFLFFSLYWILLMLLNRYLFLSDFQKLNYSSYKVLFYSILIIITAGILFITGYYNGFNLHLSLSDVYDLRYAQRKLNLPSIVGYFQPITATLVPIALVYCLIEKKYIWSLILIILQLLSFAFGGMKTTLFMLAASFLIYFFYRRNKDQILVTGFISLNIIALTEIFLWKVSYVSAYVLNRIYFMPNLISFQYYEYFNSHKLLFWRDSILNRFGLSSPYAYPVPNLIARVYNSEPNGYANNGLCGDAFSNFGWLSLIILPFMIIFFCKFIEACGRKVDRRILLITAVIFAMGFINGTFFVLLLTNGFLFAVILLYILPKQKVSFSNIE